VLGFTKYWGLCKKKIPQGWGYTRTLKCTICKVPTSARGPPLGEANDKCIRVEVKLNMKATTTKSDFVAPLPLRYQTFGHAMISSHLESYFLHENSPFKKQLHGL